MLAVLAFLFLVGHAGVMKAQPLRQGSPPAYVVASLEVVPSDYATRRIDERGRIIYVDTTQRALVRIQSAIGRWSVDAVGSWKGCVRPPGGMSSVFLFADSVAVWSGASRTLAIFDEHLVCRRTLRLSVEANGIVRLRGGVLIAEGFRGTPKSAGFPLHLFDAAGKWIRSFGSTEPIYLPSHRLAARRILSPAAGDSSVWLSHIYEDRIEQWGMDGSKIRHARVVGSRSIGSSTPADDVLRGSPIRWRIVGMQPIGNSHLLLVRMGPDAKLNGKVLPPPQSLRTMPSYYDSEIELVSLAGLEQAKL